MASHRTAQGRATTGSYRIFGQQDPLSVLLQVHPYAREDPRLRRPCQDSLKDFSFEGNIFEGDVCRLHGIRANTLRSYAFGVKVVEIIFDIDEIQCNT